MRKKHRRRCLLTLAIVIAPVAVSLSAVAKDKAVFYGGTISGDYNKVGGTRFPTRKVRHVVGQYGLKVPGRISTTSQSEFVFNSDREGSLSIPYRAILDVAYGPEVVFPSDDKQISYPWSRYFHRSLPYLTITFEDSTGVEETAVFELGSNIVRPTLDALQTRSRRQVQLQTIVACCMYKTPEECGWAPLIELKGRKKVFVDAASTNVKNRERIIEELTKARLGVELQTVAADAEVILHFDGEFGLWFPGSRRTDLTSGRATGEAYVVHEGRLRTIMVFDERWSDWKNRAAVFARKFVEAYRKAHDVK